MDVSAKAGGVNDVLPAWIVDLGGHLNRRFGAFWVGLGGTMAGAVGLAVAALISLGVVYLLALGLVVALLVRLFSGQVIWALLLVGLAHLLVAAAIVFLALRGGPAATPSNLPPPSFSSTDPIESLSSWTTPEISAN